MAKKLRKSLKLYFSKLKRIPSLSPSSPHSLLSACKYPKTPSFSASDRRNIPANPNPNPNPTNEATLSDVDRFLQENFHSLYLHDNNTTTDEDHDHDHDRVNTDEVDASSSSTSEGQAVPKDHGVAVTTFSKDPYGDFRDSMGEMVEARHKGELGASTFVTLDWDFMEEMLFCYLELNDRSVHKYILKAFTDLAVGFRKRKVVNTNTTMMMTTKAKMRRRRRRRGSDGGEWLTEMRAQRESMKERYNYNDA